MISAVLDDLRAGRVAVLARAISIVENSRPGFEQLLAATHRHLGRARRIGITGPPGAGKSTLTERLVTACRARGLRVAVVAVDPTSPFTGGALLGDRIRMESVALDPNVYIRSMATRGSLGGLATSTGEVCDVLDAAGFDRILIETVGVGQSELDVSAMADSTVLVLVPEAGDGIQTLKSGVMEIADLFVVNKADRPGAEKLRQEIEVTLGIRKGNAGRMSRGHHGAEMGRASGRAGTAATDAVLATEPPAGSPARQPAATWDPPVTLTTAAKGDGIDDLMGALDRHFEFLEASGTLEERRRARVARRTREVYERAVKRWAWTDLGAGEQIAARLDELAAGTLSPYELTTEMLDGIRQGVRT